MDKKIVVNLTHADLDGEGCSIVLGNLFASRYEFSFLKTGYLSLDKKVKQIASNMYGTDKTVFVTDLRLSAEQLHTICASEHVSRVLYFDHHMYSSEEFAEIIKLHDKKLHFKLDGSACGTKMVYEWAQKNFDPCRTNRLRDLVDLIDVYDRWQESHRDFRSSIYLNEVYWHLPEDTSFYAEAFDGCLTTLMTQWHHLYESFDDEVTSYYEKAISDYGTEIKVDERRLLVVLDPDRKYSQYYTIYRPEYSVYLMLKECKGDKMGFSVRIRNWSDVTVQGVYNLLTEKFPLGLTGGGHTVAGGFVLDTRIISPDDFVEGFVDSIAEIKKSAEDVPF